MWLLWLVQEYPLLLESQIFGHLRLDFILNWENMTFLTRRRFLSILISGKFEKKTVKFQLVQISSLPKISLKIYKYFQKFWRQDPQPFYHLVKELFPSKLTATDTHRFFTLLHQKGTFFINKNLRKFIKIQLYTCNWKKLESKNFLNFFKTFFSQKFLF